DRTVDFMSVYPTLCELCGLDVPKHCEGPSIAELCAKPKTEWSRPAITTRGPGNHTVRTERWRYIRYSDGREELYDEKTDPNEWTNLADKPEHTSLKSELAQWLPKQEAPVEKVPKTQAEKDKQRAKKKKAAAASKAAKSE